jgi:hypothetical protein
MRAVRPYQRISRYGNLPSPDPLPPRGASICRDDLTWRVPPSAWRPFED